MNNNNIDNSLRSQQASPKKFSEFYVSLNQNATSQNTSSSDCTVLRDSLLLFCGTARETVGSCVGKQKGRAAVWKLECGWSTILYLLETKERVFRSEWALFLAATV